jgi:hypothetical protein
MSLRRKGKVESLIGAVADLIFPTLKSMVEGGVKVMARVTHEALVEISLDELCVERWEILVRKCHKTQSKL